MNYEAYLRSNRWRKLRRRLILVRASQCEACHIGGALSVHHRTYERLGHERDADLTVLCQPCHTGVHQLYATDRYEALTDATDALLASQPTSAVWSPPPFVPRNQRHGPSDWRVEARTVAGLNNTWGGDD